MADGPRCKRRKQANPRRKNGKKTTGETKQAVGGLRLPLRFGGGVKVRGWCAVLPSPLYAGITGPLSREELCVNASAVRSPNSAVWNPPGK
ncbi:Zinc finger E-box-binding homeobox 2 [Liparis tanakae]|uniref:Zinc finger E-box-binding homeobox 2 n=1 Tax=Liparis tanakae TaxID=230148 RepID=A0A4Z2FAB3_9TELE|nr:Zinc finger E-box-binding homeobox 2 [Liparis tanakae]